MITEHVTGSGHLLVPVQSALWDLTPPREGWEPFWVRVNLHGHPDWAGSPEKIVVYRKV